jgi:isoleucyl-tRNA synthetase
VSAVDSFRRRSCQTVLHLVVERLAGLIAPVLCHMAEDIWQNLPYSVAEASVFERGWPTVPQEWRNPTLEPPLEQILALRTLVNRQLETCRQPQGGSGEPQGSAAAIGSSLEAQVHLEWAQGEANQDLRQALALLETSPHPEVDNLADWLLVSALQIGGETPTEVLAEATEAGLTVRISRAKGLKCERCWHYETDIGQFSDHPSLCGRCVAVLAG